MVKASLAQQDLKFTSQMYSVCIRVRWRIQTWFAGLKPSSPTAVMYLVRSQAWSDEPFSSAEGRLLQTIRSLWPMGTDCTNQRRLSDYGRPDNSRSPANRLHRTPSLQVSLLPRCHASFFWLAVCLFSCAERQFWTQRPEMKSLQKGCARLSNGGFTTVSNFFFIFFQWLNFFMT